MSTRCSITAKCEDGKFRSVYCHFDGYPDGAGATLLNSYVDQKKIEAMLALGDMSQLCDSIECPEGHSYSDSVDGHSVFYGRDRGETDVECLVKDSRNECHEKNSQAYDYFWDGENWLIGDVKLADFKEDDE